MITAETKNPTPKKRSKIAIAIDIFLWVFLVFSLLMTILAFSAQSSGNGNPTIAGRMLFFVKTDSMEGPNGFNVGDMIIGRVLTDEEKANLQVGDVITFFCDLDLSDGVDEKELNTHRIVEVVGNGSYKTKGDNKELVDIVAVYTSDIVAIWTGTRIPFLGTVLNFVQSKNGFLFTIVLPLLLFFIYKLFVMIKSIIEYRGKDQKAISAEEEEEIKRRAIEEYLAKQQQQEQKKPEEEAPPKEAESSEKGDTDSKE